jgi:hypothetical protein
MTVDMANYLADKMGIPKPRTAKIDLIVTRHPGLVAYLKEIGLADDTTQVVSHVVDPAILECRHVCGVLPHNLSCRCHLFTEVPLVGLPADLRGVELSVEQVRQYAAEPVSYRVRVV